MSTQYGYSQDNDNDIKQVRQSVEELKRAFEQLKSDSTKTKEVLAEVSRNVPVGTIVASFLRWDDFQRATSDPKVAGPVWDARSSKWAPADGRDVTGSALAQIVGAQRVPDLRGVFLRGLNQFDRSEPTPVDGTRSDPDVRSAGDYQQDNFKAHDHGGGNHTHSTGLWRAAATDWNGVVFRTDNNTNMKYATNPEAVTTPSGPIITSEGGAETRPKNVAMYYYIKIN